MIDTTTVNFAIAKMSEQFEKALPAIQNFSAEYVKFLIVQNTVIMCMFIFGFVLLATLAWFCYKKIKIAYEYSFFEVAFVLSLIASVTCFSISLGFFYGLIMLKCCPYMFLVQQIIHKAS